jgi:hypothetical protein
LLFGVDHVDQPHAPRQQAVHFLRDQKRRSSTGFGEHEDVAEELDGVTEAMIVHDQQPLAANDFT